MRDLLSISFVKDVECFVSGVILGLRGPELVVFAKRLCHYRVVCAMLDNLPVVKDQNLVAELAA